MPITALIGVGIYERFGTDRAHTLSEMKVAMDVVARTPMKRSIDSMQDIISSYAKLTGEAWKNESAINEILGRIPRPAFPSYSSVIIIDLAGNYVAGSKQQNVDSTQAAYREAMAAEGFHIGPVFNDTASHRRVFMFSAPILDRAGTRVGTLLSPFDLEILGSVFNIYAPASRPEYRTAFLDQNGTVLLHPRNMPEYLGRALPGFDRIKTRLESGEIVTIEADNFGGESVTGTLQKFAATPWSIFVWMPTDAISRDARRNLFRSLFATGVAMLIGVGMVWYFARQIAAPITALATAARAQTEGQSNSLAPVTGPREVAATAQAFNEMIQARQHIESQLARSEHRLRTVIDQTGQMVYELDLATDVAQWFGTDAVPAITGYTLDELRQMPVTSWRGMIHPEDLPAATDIFNRARAAAAPYRAEYRLRRRDGSWRMVENNGVFLSDGTGQSVRLLGRVSDITDRRQAEASLRSMAQLQVAVLDNIPVMVMAATPDGTITLVNRAGELMHGYSAAEMVGKMNAMVMHDPAEVAARAAQFSAELGEPVAPGLDVFTVHARRNLPNEYEWTCIRKDGSRFPILLTVAALRDHAGQITGYAGVVTDLTERRKAETSRQAIEKKMLETQKLESLGILAGGIAHDFNNLLTGVLGHASLAKLILPPGTPALQNIDQIEVASRRAAELCRQMLAYSGKGHFVVQRLDLNQIVEDSTHLLQISVSKQCVLRTNLARPLPTISADATQVRQIIMNLVINASEAIGTRSGVIALTTGVVRTDDAYLKTLRFTPDIPAGDYVFIEISDNGCGMDEATLNQIFDPFFTTKFTGRGLGLAAVLGIMRGHRGGVKVYSEPSRGTTFKMLFPCVAGPAENLDSHLTSQVAWRGRGTVLVIDDEETVRAVSARMLESLGFGVVLAEHGRDGFEKFRLEPDRYSLVLLDLTMPHMDGQETFRQLRALRPAVKILLMSGFNQQEAISRFAGKGLAGFVQKPFEVTTLAVEIRRVLESPNGAG